MTGIAPEDVPNSIAVPEQFFRQALLEISDIDELKITLYIYWRLNRMEGPFHYLRFSDLLKDARVVQSMGAGPRKVSKRLREALQKAVDRGSLLQVEIPPKRDRDILICLNSPRGRAIVDAILRGDQRVIDDTLQGTDVYVERPNIFQLYETNIGPLTPLIADALRDAEKTYQRIWIEDAFRIAVERNKRNWHYIEAILRRWQEGGRDGQKEQQDRRDSEEARRRYADWDK